MCAKVKGNCLLGLVLALALADASVADEAPLQLIGWGGGKPEEVTPLAAKAGFTKIVVWSQNPGYLGRMVAEGAKEGIGIYASIYLNDVAGWKKAHPSMPTPLQEMNEEENAALKRIESDASFGRSHYQYGGEPCQEMEVLREAMLCFHHPEVVEYFRGQIKTILAVPGIEGVAFDFFGYRNYRCCRCKHSMDLFEEYRRNHPDEPYDKALETFSLNSLVAFNNDLADYARSVAPGAKVLNHVHPVFLPEPLYGNRLNVDVCGQTAAWFFEPYWDLDKIRNYSRIISKDARKYYSRCEGSALIGYQNRPNDSVKTPERVSQELQAILDGGCRSVQVCSMNDVLKTPEVRDVFRKYFYKGK